MPPVRGTEPGQYPNLLPMDFMTDILEPNLAVIQGRCLPIGSSRGDRQPVDAIEREVPDVVRVEVHFVGNMDLDASAGT